MFQFLTFTNGSRLGSWLQLALALGFVGLIAVLALRRPAKRRALLLLALYSLIGPILIWAVSLGKRPIYVDRYFVFAAIGFYSLLAVMIAELPRRLAVGAIAITLVVFGYGIHTVHRSANHQMRVIGAYVTQRYQPGDEILSGELYTFFDFSYYNHTGEQTKLWSSRGVSGYGESSLIYDRASQIVVENLNNIHPASGRLWVVGKTGQHAYYDPQVLPAGWVPVGPHVTAGYCAVQEYLVPPRGQTRVAVQYTNKP